MRSFRRRRTGVRKKGVWINVPFGGVNFTESVGAQLLLTAEDWEAQFAGTANETAVLRRVVGEIMVMQTAVGTLGNVCFWGIYLQDKNATVPPTFATTGMDDSDWLRVGCMPAAASVTATANQATRLFTHEIDIKAKRKIKSRDAIYIAAQYGSDGASPGGVIAGMLRFLVARD